MRARLTRSLAAAFPFLLLVPVPARALTIVSHFEGYVSTTQTFEFAITFSAPPDFVTVDEFGRLKDDFQYWITWNLHVSDPLYPVANPDVLVRGIEPGTPGGIPIRDASGDGGPGSGGWGPIRGIVPYKLNGATITFIVPREMLGDSDGAFSYVLGVFLYGGTTDQRTGISGTGPVATVSSTWGRVKAIYR